MLLQGCFIGCDECDHMSGRRQTDLCKKGKKSTVNDPQYRSVNRNATAGSTEDIYRHNPWRAPGNAPIGAENAPPFYQDRLGGWVKMMLLPRQARDKHEETLNKGGGFCR